MCGSSAVPGHGWPTPELACRLIDLETCHLARGEPNGLRMSFFDCNKPSTEGYSAAICGLHISKLYAHHPGTNSSFYEELDNVSSSMLWIYMPIDQDEYLADVWAIRHAHSGFIALMIGSGSLYRGIDVNTAKTDISTPHGEEERRSQYPPSLIPTSPPPYTPV
ncbi:Uncharacterized protein TPAR_04278 [Tolypocladium paradoxum]|uniref:Uncharacterized protein n=1 Tax=Tolypocladium paradoxum TaxID=94208 RepID=A0A2S4KZC6_9HYPO|nr:Uncharacterized protein TPAR_04278 [Tolypocladium paradoxum]